MQSITIRRDQVVMLRSTKHGVTLEIVRRMTPQMSRLRASILKTCKARRFTLADLKRSMNVWRKAPKHRQRVFDRTFRAMLRDGAIKAIGRSRNGTAVFKVKWEDIV